MSGHECNDIGKEGAKALAEALKVNTTLTSLNLDNNKIGKKERKALGAALKINRLNSSKRESTQP